MLQGMSDFMRRNGNRYDRTMSPITIKYRYMISYMDAAKFLERLEQDGIVSQWDEVVGSPRTILKTSQSSGNV